MRQIIKKGVRKMKINLNETPRVERTIVIGTSLDPEEVQVISHGSDLELLNVSWSLYDFTLAAFRIPIETKITERYLEQITKQMEIDYKAVSVLAI
jgi:hypothetical protein